MFEKVALNNANFWGDPNFLYWTLNKGLNSF